MHGTATIEINNKKWALRFNNHFLFELGESLKVDALGAATAVMELAAKKPLQGLTHVVYASAIAAEYEQGNFTPEITFKEVASFVSNAKQVDLEPIYKQFKEAMAIPDATPEQVEETEKELAEEKKS